MNNILFIFERNMPTVVLLRQQFEAMSKQGDFICSFQYCNEISNEMICKNDIFVFIRSNDLLSYRIAQIAKKNKKTVIFFCDDDLINYKPLAPWRRKHLVNTLKNSDVFLTYSRYLAQKYKDYIDTKRTAVTDNLVELGNHTGSLNRQGNKVKIVYASSNNNMPMFLKYIRPVLGKLAEKYGDRISLHFVGIKPDVENIEDRISVCYKNTMPLIEYRAYMKKECFDIGLAPLEDTEFSRCKHYNKFIEYTSVGVVGIYSKIIPYTYAVEDGVNGFLANNTEEGWFETVSKAIDEERLRKKCLNGAFEYASEHLSARALYDDLLMQIPELNEDKKDFATNNQERVGYLLPLWKINYSLLRIMDYLYSGFYYLLNEGVSGFCGRIRYHVANGKAYSK